MGAQYKKRKVLTMRKLLAVLLAAIMLVGALAVLPVGAEEATPAKSTFDGTTSDETMDLIITEIMVDSATGVPQVDESSNATLYPDAFDYIEIYNAGNSAVNLYEYQLLMAQGTGFTKDLKGKFSSRVDLAGGSPFNSADTAGAKYNHYDGFNNPTTAVLHPGQFAVIWFYTYDTSRLSSYYGDSEQVNLDYFKEHYGMASDSLVIAVCGETNMGTSFKLENNAVYALAYDSFDFSKSAVTNAFSDSASLSEDIVCMAQLVRGKAPFSEYAKNVAADIVWSANYVPANLTPDFENANNKYAAEEGETPKVYADYVQELGHSMSYRSVAAAATSAAPTPGKMPAWQWAYVGADKLEESAGNNAAMEKLVSDWKDNTAIKKDNALNTTDQNGESAWISAAINAYITAIQQNIDNDGRADSTEQKIDYSKNFVDRAELERRHGLNKKQNTNEKKGLPIWALILIIVGGVALVGGAAVVVIIIIKKKNRPVAADDVAAEGEIEIVDETAANEAPVEDTPVEEDKE